MGVVHIGTVVREVGDAVFVAVGGGWGGFGGRGRWGRRGLFVRKEIPLALVAAGLAIEPFEVKGAHARSRVGRKACLLRHRGGACAGSGGRYGRRVVAAL